MAEKYSRLTDAQKPSVPRCDHCNAPQYQRDVCHVSGFYHKDSQGDRSVCGQVLPCDTKMVSTSQLVEFTSQLKIKWEEARVKNVRIDESSATLLQSFCRSIQWTPAVYGILYGKFDEPSQTIEIHTIYEAQCICKDQRIDEKYDERIPKVDHLASLFGLRRVGVVVARIATSEDDILRSEEFLWAVQAQSRFGDASVVITIAPNVEDNTTNVEAWQLSQQSVHLFRSQFLSPSDDPFKVRTKVEVEVAQSRDEKKKTSHMAAANEVDIKWLVAPAAVAAFQSNVVANRFVRIYRLENDPPGFHNLRIYMQDPERQSLPFPEKLRDFHLLIFLMESLLDAYNDIPIIVKAIQTGDAQSIEGIRVLIDTCTESA